MSDNLPEVRTTNEVMKPADTDSWTTVVGEVAKLASYIADTEFVPKGLRGKAPAAAAAILYGREVGLPPMTALNGTHVIEGSPSISAELMRAMVLAEGHDLEFVESTGARCVVRGRRRGGETWTTVEWTIDMARAAGLLNKTNWKSWPRRMLQARGSSELIEMVFPDVIHGFRSIEEQLDRLDIDEPTDGFGQPATSTVQRVSGTRKRAAKKAAALPAAPAPAERPAAGAVPLPGEPGYDDTGAPGQTTEPDQTETTQTGAGSPEESEASSPASEPEDSQEEAASGDPAADEGAPEVPGHTSGAPAIDEPVDAEVVGEEKSPPPRPVSGPQVRMVQSQFGRFAFEGTRDEQRDERLAITSTLVGREVESTNELTKDEAQGLIDTLATCKTREQLDALVAGVRDAEAEAQRGES